MQEISVKSVQNTRFRYLNSIFGSGYSSSPDLANAATVWVSLVEGSRRKDSQIQEKMVFKRQYLEILRSLIIFWQDRCRPQFNHSWDCRRHIFWLYDHRNIRHRPTILEKLPSLINFWQDRRCPQQGSTVLPLLRFLVFAIFVIHRLHFFSESWCQTDRIFWIIYDL